MSKVVKLIQLCHDHCQTFGRSNDDNYKAMNEITPEKDLSERQTKPFLLTFWGILLTVILSVGLSVWLINIYFFPSRFDPVELNQKENQTLKQKLSQFSGFKNSQTTNNSRSEKPKLNPEKFSEQGAKREIHLTERELNALLAKNTDMADKLAIDLSDNLASGKLLMPLDEGFPVLGGKTLKISAGMELAFSNDRPLIKLRGVSIMGIPVPNAWLGGLKNVDLINEFGQDEGFWKAFSDGISDIHVVEGNLIIKLKE